MSKKIDYWEYDKNYDDQRRSVKNYDDQRSSVTPSENC